MGVHGEPELLLPPEQGAIRRFIRTVIFSVLSIIVLPFVFLYGLLLHKSAVVDTFSKVFIKKALDRRNVFDTKSREFVWSTKMGKIYARALEYQVMEGYCSSATQRCMLKSHNIALEDAGKPVLPLPPSLKKPDVPEGFQKNIEKYLKNGNQAGRLEINIVRGAENEDQYEAFLKTMKLTVHPSGKYRVAVNFLRSAIFGVHNYLPHNLLLGML